MAKGDKSLLNRLRRAVKKVKFLLNFKITNLWNLVPMIGSSSSRRLSFKDRPGLMAACTEEDEPVYEDSNHSPSSSRGMLYRTTSYPSSDEDIDKKAEVFIANFYRQLKIERQISLELKYYRGNSFEYKSP